MRKFLKILPVLCVFMAFPLVVDANPFTGTKTSPSASQPVIPSLGGFNLPIPQELLNWQRELNQGLSQFMRRATEPDGGGALFLLLGIAALYGILHTLLPGHQKGLVAAYFLSERAGYSQAWIMGGLFLVFHTVNAVALIWGLSALLSLSFHTSLDLTAQYTQVISGWGVIGVGIYLLWTKIGAWKRARAQAHLRRVQNLMGFTLQQKIETINSPIPWKKFLSLIIFAGIVPCPGTMLVMVFALGLGSPGLGILSILFISVGMALFLTLMALFVIAVKKAGTQWATRSGGEVTWLPLVEIGAAVLLILFSVFLVF